MEISQVLRMNGGTGETSYAANSLLQEKVIYMTMGIMEEAISKVYGSISSHKRMAIADLGCSSGPNTLLAVSRIVGALVDISKKHHRTPPEVQVFLNDLPGNDFNTIFRSLSNTQSQEWRKNQDGSPLCFIAGAPGSFYTRLFPSQTLHFVHSSYSLHWLSQVPDGLEGNKGNIYMASTSHPTILKAYYKQFEMDFSEFLKCRAEELVPGGYMVLTLLGRKSEDPSSKECCYVWELLAMVLNDMVSEGLLEEEKVDGFNVPQYTPSPSELKRVVETEGSFAVDRLEISEVNWNVCGNNDSCASAGAYKFARCMRAVAEPMLASHFREEGVLDEVFRRYGELAADRMAKERTEFINVSVSLKRG